MILTFSYMFFASFKLFKSFSYLFAVFAVHPFLLFFLCSQSNRNYFLSEQQGTYFSYYDITTVEILVLSRICLENPKVCQPDVISVKRCKRIKVKNAVTYPSGAVLPNTVSD